MNLFYNVNDWYWIVAASTTQVWSSARRSYVAQNDAQYLAWQQRGGVPARVDTQAELFDIIVKQAPYIAEQVAPNRLRELYLSSMDQDSASSMLFRIAFNHENRIRALENRAAVTMTQFRNALIANTLS